MGALFNVKVGEFGYHTKQNDVNHSALYVIQIPRPLNNGQKLTSIARSIDISYLVGEAHRQETNYLNANLNFAAG